MASLLPLFAFTAVAVLAAAGPAAAGTGYGQLIVNPGTVAQGQSVSILGVCPTNGSTLSGVNSTAFVGGSASITIGSENFTGTATISSTIAPGTYTVMASCGAGSPSVNIVVTAGSVKPTTAPATTHAPTMPAAPTSSQAAAPPPTSAAPTRASSTGGMGVATTPSVGMTSMSGMPSTTSALGMGGPVTTSAAPAVTSTGVIRVGLAGQSSPMSKMISPALVVAAFVLACAMGFLIRRRRRNSSASHE